MNDYLYFTELYVKNIENLLSLAIVLPVMLFECYTVHVHRDRQ